jgi:oligopeptide transport system ATP-binding protein
LLKVNDLYVRFQTGVGTVEAVRGVNLDLEEGQSLAIVGESGSGKSVTVQSIMRLLQSHARTSGNINWDGRDLLTLSEKQMQSLRGGDIGMVFQDPMTALNPTMKIGKQIAEVVMRHKRMSTQAAMHEAVRLLELVGIPDPSLRVHNYPHQFSGGMRQRVVIAMAIACSPRLLIADEPTTALDVTVQAQILETLGELQQKLNMSLLLITHDLAVVDMVAERVAVMYAGRIVETGTTQEVLRQPRHPYTRGLLDCKPQHGVKAKLRPIPGAPPDMLHPPKGCAFASRCPYAMKICAEESPPTFQVEQKHVACWLADPRAEGSSQWNSYTSTM